MKWFSKKKAFALVFAAGFAFSGMYGSAAAYSQKDLNEGLVMPAAWMQNSAEYRELCYQAYNVALERVEDAVKAHKKGDKPLAIVLDADETVLDNSAFEAGLVGTDRAYSTEAWTAWCRAQKAAAMPGAAKFLQTVDSLGVSIFYVTNRSMDTQYESSAKNMKAIGFPQVDKEHMLFKTDTSDKQPRFDHVLKAYDVVVFMGDNAGDLPIGTYQKGQAERNGLVDAHQALFGKKFIALPNPMYGDWVPALLKDGKPGGYWKLTPEEKAAARRAALRTWQDGEEN